MELADPGHTALGSADQSTALPITWRRSSWCSANSCVEIADLPGGVAIRDSKSPEAPPLTFAADEWQSFIAGVKAGEFG
jgi:predicted secreted Zn-dependent protease